jgi:hypothetical protein
MKIQGNIGPVLTKKQTDENDKRQNQIINIFRIVPKYVGFY